MKEMLLILTLAGLAGCSLPAAPQAGEASLTETTQASRKASLNPTAIAKLNPKLVAVDTQPFATPPRLVMTIKGSGWGESDILPGFAVDATSLLKKMAKKKLIPVDHGITFIIRVEGESEGKMREYNVLHIAIDQQVVQSISGGADVSAQALLDSSDVEFNGRLGRRITERFCSDEKYQGAAGVLRTVAFCDQALGDRDLSSS